VNHHIDKDAAGDSERVDGRACVPAAAGGVRAYEAEQVQDHGRLQRVPSHEALALQHHHDDQGRHEGRRVEVEEDPVPPRMRRQEGRVSDDVALPAVSPDAAR